MEKLAILGGKPYVNERAPKELFKWPIITEEDEQAIMDVIRNNKFSGTDITQKFENEFKDWLGREYAIAYTNGTLSLAAAMYAIGLGAGDEVICPTKTYWASIIQSAIMGATPVFCNITDNLVIDPEDIERCITPKTKAIMVVHYFGYPCDMDRVMEIANKHNLYVLEDVSHAQGGMYKGKRLGTFGHVAAMSLMSGKVFAAGELGILVTDDRKFYERAMAYAHYERNNANYIVETEELKPYFHVALGAVKGRANQVCTALARGQLKYFDERCAEIRKAMNYFFDLLEGLPGIRPIRVDESTGSNMGGFYQAQLAVFPEEIGGIPAQLFAKAVSEEFNGAFVSWSGANFCLHTHEYFKTYDFLNLGKPTRIAFSDRDLRVDDEKLIPSEHKYSMTVPWFKKYDKEWIETYAGAIRKVAENWQQLLEINEEEQEVGRWHGTENAVEQQKTKKGK